MNGFEREAEGAAEEPPAPDNAILAAFSRLLEYCNSILLQISMGALILTAVILTYSVLTRYFFKAPTDWQDEASVFMLIGVTFFCAAYVQSCRGHIGIEALASLLPRCVNRVRLFLVDSVSCLFSAFFSWKSWTLFYEAAREGQTTQSTLAPPLWIPYIMMALGMTLLTLQILVQVFTHLSNRGRTP